MSNHDVLAVVGQGRVGADVGDGAVGGGGDGIRGFAGAIALCAADIDAFVELVAVAPDASKGSAGPGASGRAGERGIPPGGVEDLAIRGGDLEGLGGLTMQGGRRQNQEQRCCPSCGAKGRHASMTWQITWPI